MLRIENTFIHITPLGESSHTLVKSGVWSEEEIEEFVKKIMVTPHSWKYHVYAHDKCVKYPAERKCCEKWIKLINVANTCVVCDTKYSTLGVVLTHNDKEGDESDERHPYRDYLY